MKFDLGGSGPGAGGWQTVNLWAGADITADVLDVDWYAEDEKVDAFRLSHTLEHIPLPELHDFLRALRRKLRPGGVLTVVQTDARRVLRLYRDGSIDFYVLRDILFVCPERRVEGIEATGRDVQQHQFMWGAEELAAELTMLAYECEVFDAGSWQFDVPSSYPFQRNETYFGFPIPNLGVRARRPA